MKKIKKIKWELGTALVMSVASIVLAVVWIISLIQGDTERYESRTLALFEAQPSMKEVFFRVVFI